MDVPLGTEDEGPLEAKLRAELEPAIEAKVRAELEPQADAARELERDRAARALTILVLVLIGAVVPYLGLVLGVAWRLMMWAAVGRWG